MEGAPSKKSQKRFLHDFADLLGHRTKKELLALVRMWVDDEEPEGPPVVLGRPSGKGVAIDLDRLPPEVLARLYGVARARFDELNRPAT